MAGTLLVAAMLSSVTSSVSMSQDYTTEPTFVEVGEEDLQRINELLLQFRKDTAKGELRGVVAVEMDEDTNTESVILFATSAAAPSEACYDRCSESGVWHDSNFYTSVWCQAPNYNPADPNRRVQHDKYWFNKWYDKNVPPDAACLRSNGTPNVSQKIFDKLCGASRC